MNQRQWSRLHTAKIRILRRLAGVRLIVKVPNKGIRKKLGVKPLKTYIKQMKIT